MVGATKTDWKNMRAERLSENITRKFVHGKNVMLAEIRLEKGAVVPEHRHVSEQVSWIVEGGLLFEIEGSEIYVGAGEVLVIPPDVPHKATALEYTVDIDMFSPVREDWISGNDSYLRKQ